MSYLTERQKEVLDFIKRSIEERGVAPTLSEIAEEFSFSSTASSQKHLLALARKGYIRRFPNQKRGIVVVAEKKKSYIGSEVLLTTINWEDRGPKKLRAFAAFNSRQVICLSSISLHKEDISKTLTQIDGWTVKPVTITWEV